MQVLEDYDPTLSLIKTKCPSRRQIYKNATTLTCKSSCNCCEIADKEPEGNSCAVFKPAVGIRDKISWQT
jgi:hypothetical protein